MSDATTTTVPAARPVAGGDRFAADLARARAFTSWIDRRCYEDPGVRAALRRGRGKDLDSVPFMHRHVATWLTEEQMVDQGVQQAYYTVASLIAAQRRNQYAAAKTTATPADTDADGDAGAQKEPPARTAARSLGLSFADGVAMGGTEGLRATSAETRLNLLTRQSTDGLHRHLPGAIRQLRDRDVDVDWAQLLVDLCRWSRHAGSVKRRWLQDYYRARQKDELQRAKDADTERAATQDLAADQPAAP